MKTMHMLLSDLQGEFGSRGKRLSGIAVLCCLLFAFAAPARSQSSEWVWMNGSAAVGTLNSTSGEYGTSGTCGIQGKVDTSFTPGSRTQAVTWTDHAGYLWLFGGQGLDCEGNYGYLNDLWKYDPWNKEWALMSATQTKTSFAANQAAQANAPGSISGAIGWVNSNDGTLWLFGGLGYVTAYGPGPLNDLWKFDPSAATITWTYVGGTKTTNSPGTYGNEGKPESTNIPGSRYGASSWTDSSGNFWLYGGMGGEVGNSNYNDLWEYNPGNNEWAWMGGDYLPSLSGTAPAYPGGPVGTSGTNLSPGSRFGATSWTDESGNFWLFGGQGSNISSYNDVWKLTPGAYPEAWAYMGGNKTTNTPPAGGFPRSRWLAASWNDGNGKLWLFGGEGNGYNTIPASADNLDYFNGFWNFNPSAPSNPLLPLVQWNLASGSDLEEGCLSGSCSGQAGSYGTVQAPASGHFPGSRDGAASWTDSGGNLWLFGGCDFDNLNNHNRCFNDLWEYQPYSQTATPTFNPGTGNYSGPLYVIISDATPGATIYYTTNGSTPTPTVSDQCTTLFDGNCMVSITSTKTLTAIAMASGNTASNSATATYTMTVAAPVITPPSGTYNAVTVRIADTTPGATIYYTTGNTVPSPANGIVYSGPIILTASTTINAIAVETGYSNSAIATATYTISSTASAAGEWTWMSGSSTASQFGVYGTLGAFAPGFFPGSRFSASSWIDSNGDFWLFGGLGSGSAGSSGDLNDLWEFNPNPGANANDWAWMGGSNTGNQPGVYSGTLNPGGRDSAATWTDGKGNYWFYGGSGVDANGAAGFLDDMWELTPSASPILWTFLGGDSTITCGTYGGCGHVASYGTPQTPGGRAGASTWIDGSGNLWLFGGNGMGTDINQFPDYHNDLWEFIPNTGWTFVSGDQTFFQPGVYTAPGKPGGREYASSWTDSKGNFWLFGGFGIDVNGEQGYLSDLWEYSPSSGWVFMGGNDTVFQPGSCPTPWASSCTPGSRMGAVTWTDKSTNTLWLFGGQGLDANGLYGDLNDLWAYVPAVGWGFVDGSDTVRFNYSGQPGVYGTVGAPAAGNNPGGRYYATSSIDNNHNLWLFGGEGYDIAGNFGFLNDLWEYVPATSINAIPYAQASPLSNAFTLGVPPASLSVARGGSVTDTITITKLNGFTGNVLLSASGLPSGVTASFNPNPATGSSVLTLTASNTAAFGTYNIAITGTSGSQTANTVIPFTVNGFACHIGYTITTQWPGNFQANITINNTGTVAIKNWTLTWSFANGQKITQLWDGNATQSGANVTVANMSYNGSIPAGSSYVGVGFNGTWNNITDAIPASFAINGTTCR
jgi:hypothetical protein